MSELTNAMLLKKTHHERSDYGRSKKGIYTAAGC